MIRAAIVCTRSNGLRCGPVLDRLTAAVADAAALAEWNRLVATEIMPEHDADEFGG